nr:hypothetical protein [Methylobacterium sp. ZNC0032]
MLNATARAAATGLPAAIFNRRRMLIGLAAASTAAAGPVAVAAGVQAPAESAELLDLGAKTAFVLAGYRQAVEEREAIMEAWAPKVPAIPKALLCHSSYGRPRRILERRTADSWFTHIASRESIERDIAYWSGRPEHRKNAKPELIAKRVANRARYVVDAKARLAALEQYESRYELLEDASGIRPAIRAHLKALELLAAHARDVMAIEPVTIAGVLIQAEALEALSYAPPFERIAWEGSTPARRGYGERIAASILRIAGNA